MDVRSAIPEMLLFAAIKLFIFGRLVDLSFSVAFLIEAIYFLKETFMALVFNDAAPDPITKDVFSFLAL